jgi:hypothetical protein
MDAIDEIQEASINLNKFKNNSALKIEEIKEEHETSSTTISTNISNQL